MKVQAIFLVTLAVASASWEPEPMKYHGPLHMPVIHNGVPVETPEVQQAKAAHYAAFAEAYARPDSHDDYAHEEETHDFSSNSDGDHSGGYGYQVIHVAQEHQVPDISSHYVSPAYEMSHVVPVIGHDGKPLDTPEVEAAKAKHFAAYYEALTRTAPKGASYHYRKRRSADYYPDFSVLEHQQQAAPEETFEVQQAKAEHLAAHAHAHSGTYGFTYHQVHAPIYENHYSHEVPEIGHDGKPLDTAEVEQAKAEHFAAHNEALLRLAGHSAGHEGVMDTSEVQHAKLMHFAAHAAAKGHYY